MKQPVVYVAGPYRPRGAWRFWPLSSIARLYHVLRASQAAAHLWRLGYAVICPHSNCYLPAMFATDLPDTTWIIGDLTLLERCDALYYLGTSPGANLELGAAEKGNLTVWERLEDIPRAENFPHVLSQ